MFRPVSSIALFVIVTACASQQRAGSTNPDTLSGGAVQYRCESGERFAARTDGVSAQILYNGVTYTLPQLSNVADVQVYADNRHRLENRRSRIWFGPNGTPLRQCTAQ